jgi:hypothetical protein
MPRAGNWNSSTAAELMAEVFHPGLWDNGTWRPGRTGGA